MSAKQRAEAKTHTPVYISGAEVEQVKFFRFLGIDIAENLSWSSQITTLVEKKENKLKKKKRKTLLLKET